MKKELTRVFFHHGENSAVGWYRVVQPMRAVTKNKLARVVTLDFEPGREVADIPVDSLENIIQWSDVAVFSRLGNPRALSAPGAIKQTYHIPVLMELDDLPMEMNDDSWAFSQYRSDNPMGGTDAAYWAIKQMELSDGIIVTNDYLRMRIEKLVPKKRVHVIPNCVDTKLFKNKKSDIITIGWQGGSNHVRDLELIREPILKILKEFPNVRFQTFGHQPAWTIGVKGCKHQTWVHFDKYYKTLGDLGLSIGVAPLVDNAFNRCKSNLRWLEYSALGIPTVASRVGPYQCIRDNVTGYYANDPHEWYTKLRTLIQRQALRKRIGDNAHRTVKRSFNPDIWAAYYAKLFRFYAAQFARTARASGIKPVRQLSTREAFQGRTDPRPEESTPFPV